MKRALVTTFMVVEMVGAGVATAVDTVSKVSGSAVSPLITDQNQQEELTPETWGFEPGEGFVPGWIDGQVGWSALYDRTVEAHIDTAIPHTGTQHLRIYPEPNPDGDEIGAASPYVPDPTPDASSISVWVAMNPAIYSSHVVSLRARSQSFVTAAVNFEWTGSILVRGSNGSWVDTGADWTPGGYVQMVIDVDPAGNTITYWYGGNQIYSQSVNDGTVIEQVTLFWIGSEVGGYADFDDLLIDRGSLEPVLHRWDFTTDGSDSVGGADAALLNGAYVSGGALVLDGYDDYAELPVADTLKLLTNVSVEAWVVWQGGRSWERIFDFGNDTTTNWFLTPSASQTGKPRAAITVAGNPGEQRTDSSVTCPLNKRTHLVFTLEGNGYSNQGKLYINGTLVGDYGVGSALDPRELGRLSNVWLGRSQYSQDPFFMGEIEEFAIYGTVLTELQVLDLYRWVFADGFESGDTAGWSTAVP